MNTIPTTLNDRPVPYTVVGSPPAKAGAEGLAVSVILLGRGSRLYRNDALCDLERFGFDSIVSIEDGADAVDIESLAQRHPSTRFILLGSPRIDGNSTRLAYAFADAASRNGHAVQSLRLSALRIAPCDGCRRCWEQASSSASGNNPCASIASPPRRIPSARAATTRPG